MSNATDTIGCVSHKGNSRFFIMYEDFLNVARASEHQYKLAAFWRVLETKTNDQLTYLKKKAEENKKPLPPLNKLELWVEVSYSECVNRSLGLYKSSSFQIAAAESERLGFSKSKVLKRNVNPSDPASPLEDYKVYLFLTDVMQKAIDGGELPTPIENNSPLLKRQKRSTPIENNTPPLLKTIDPPIENNRKKDSKDKDKDKRERVAPAGATTPSLFPEESENQNQPSQAVSDPIATTPIDLDAKRQAKNPTPSQASLKRAMFDSYNQTMRDLFKDNSIAALEAGHTNGHVEALIKAGGTPEMLRLVIVNMHQECKNGEYWWRDTARLTLKAVCNQYGARAPKIKVTLEQAQPAPTTSDVPTIKELIAQVRSLEAQKDEMFNTDLYATGKLEYIQLGKRITDLHCLISRLIQASKEAKAREQIS